MSEKREWKINQRTTENHLLQIVKEQEAAKCLQAVRVDHRTIIFVPMGCNVSEHVEAWKKALNYSRERINTGGSRNENEED